MEEDSSPPPSTMKRPGPSDISDPMLRQEARKAFVWVGVAALIALAMFVAQPLLVIFGGIIFSALIDGGVRLLGRVLPIGRGWRVAIVLLVTAMFLLWVAFLAGTQIVAEAAALPETIRQQGLQALRWFEGHGIETDLNDVEGYFQQALGGVSYLTQAVGGLIGVVTTLFLIVVLGIYFVAEPRLYQRGLSWMLPRGRRSHFRETIDIMGSSLRRLLAGRLIGMTIALERQAAHQNGGGGA